jgi:RNA polymerase sigma-70 factor, ECF subfamily
LTFLNKAPKKDAIEAALRIKSKRSFPDSADGTIREELSDEKLLSQVVKGDSTALEILYDRYASTVLGISFRFNNDRAMAEDVLQETFWRVWRNAATYQPQLGSFAVWLFRITRNLVVDLHRKQNIRPQAVRYTDYEEPNIEQTPDPNADVPEQAQSLLKHRQVRAALAVLPSEQKQVLEMAYFYGMTRQEIAEATGEPLGTIHTRARLALQKLRRELEKQEFEG